MITSEQIFDFESYNQVLESAKNDIYADSPFKVVRNLSSSKKGSFFERLTKEYLKSKGFTVSKREDSGHDCVVKGAVDKYLVEVKGSSLWEGGSQFRWGQIRPSQNYSVVCFVAMWPDRLEFLASPKDAVSEYVLEQDEEGNWLHNMHGGKTVNSGTFLIQGFPEQFSWMRPLEEVIR